MMSTTMTTRAARLRPGGVRKLLGLGLSAALAANALAMLAWPLPWYRVMPGVAETGPLNLHFVRDLGAAYLVAALGLAWHALQRSAWPAAAAGAAFLSLHAGVHGFEFASGLCTPQRFAGDIPGVVLPALAAALLAWPARDLEEGGHA